MEQNHELRKKWRRGVKHKRLAGSITSFSILCLLVVTACGGDTVQPPPLPVTRECERLHTATFSVTNDTASVSVRVVRNGLVVVSAVARGATSPSVTVPAGVDQTIRVVDNSTDFTLCSATTSFAACANITILCS